MYEKQCYAEMIDNGAKMDHGEAEHDGNDEKCMSKMMLKLDAEKMEIMKESNTQRLASNI